MSANVRSAFEASLAADWKTDTTLRDVRVIATERSLDAAGNRPTALIRQRGLARNADAPMSHRNVNFLLTLISPYTDLDKAADQLDSLVSAALDYLDTRYLHGDAEASAWGDSQLAYDITVTVITTKE